MNRTQIAEKYDQLWASNYSLNISPEAAIEFFEFSRPFKGMMVLDVGCGSAAFFDANKNFPMDVWGIDPSRVAIEKAKKRVPSGNFQIGWAESLPFVDGLFDRVYCLGSLEHFVDMSQALGEIKRVLKANGLILLQVPIGDIESGGEQPIKRVMRKEEWNKLYGEVGLKILRSVEEHGCDWSLCQKLGD